MTLKFHSRKIQHQGTPIEPVEAILRRESEAKADSDSTSKLPALCYLCGRPLSDPTSKDHCPPRALFSREIRQQYNLNQLITFPVHTDCNVSYSRDEEYFRATMVPFARGSIAGNTIYKKFMEDAREDKHKMFLAEKIRREFEPRPGGIFLPPGLVAKRQEGDRIGRIAWKIVRGLYLHHHEALLPETFAVSCEMIPPDRRPPDHFLYVSSLADDETHGVYGGVFDYRFRVFKTELGKLNYWALLIWDRIIMILLFHDPWTCKCEGCTSAIEEMKLRAAGDAPCS